MKANELITIWKAPDAQQLTAKQLSIRLPMQVSAKISALCELFKKRTKTDIIGDLLTTALEALEGELPMYVDHDDGLGAPPGGAECYYGFRGTRKRYFQLAEKYLRELEKEAGIEEPMEFSTNFYYPESAFKWEKD